MRVKLNVRDAMAIILLIIIYVPLITHVSLGQETNFLLHLWENYDIGKVIVVANPICSVIFWLWMLFDWGNRSFIKKKYKIYWFIIFFVTYFLGSTVYYFLVCKFRKGLSSK